MFATTPHLPPPKYVLASCVASLVMFTRKLFVWF